MYTEAINKIKTKMKNDLTPTQLAKLGEVLSEVLYAPASCNVPKKERKNLVKKFIIAKRIEGCSKRTEEYYFSTLDFFAKNVRKDLCSIETNDI